ncbi:Uncharacterised protein [Mycobacteroides abscessus subsp. abscessus]|nr:Uncharacterised protein [Mycobacteroides abscessus subsp. abscessus]
MLLQKPCTKTMVTSAFSGPWARTASGTPSVAVTVLGSSASNRAKSSAT